ncbi:hypothetical protein ACHAPT_013434 [Fusarium lateritium]
MDTWNYSSLPSLYTPLLGNNPLRVLRLEPGARCDSIICQLIPTDLDAVDNPFIATSYTWGSLQDPQQIQCNGCAMTVQKNAFDLLTDLRLPDQPRTIWIDAICINQGDVSERSEQVQMMHMIYSRAQSVTIWLGRADEHSHAAMTFAATLDVDKYMDQFIRHLHAGVPDNIIVYGQKTYSLDHPLQSDEEKQLAVSMVSFVNRPWFSRIWVQQEGSVNQNTQVQDLDYIYASCADTYMNGDPATEAYKLTIISATDHYQGLVDTKYTLDNWDSWLCWLGQDDCDLNSVGQDTPLLSGATQNSGIFRDFRFAVTKHGYFCLVPSITQVKDRVAVLTGYMVCNALRP